MLFLCYKFPREEKVPGFSYRGKRTGRKANFCLILGGPSSRPRAERGCLLSAASLEAALYYQDCLEGAFKITEESFQDYRGVNL